MTGSAESDALVAGECAVCPDVINPGETTVFYGGNDVRHRVCPEDRTSVFDTHVTPPAERNA